MTRIAVDPAPGRARVLHTPGPVVARVQRVDELGARIALVATTALLLGGDEVEFDVRVGRGAWLEIVEVAGTVAYDARGVASRWIVRAHLDPGARLTWHGEPFVVADGADVTRTTTLQLAEDAAACLRETLVFGRVGEAGGALQSTTHVLLEGRDLLLETLDLPNAALRRMPGVLGACRVIDTVLMVGRRAPESPALPVHTRYDLAGPGTVARVLAESADSSGLDAVWSSWRCGVHGAP